MLPNIDESIETTTCVGCGAELSPETDRAFATGPDTFLCFACATQSGGVYDADQDRWTVPPDVSGIADERRPHA